MRSWQRPRLRDWSPPPWAGRSLDRIVWHRPRIISTDVRRPGTRDLLLKNVNKPTLEGETITMETEQDPTRYRLFVGVDIAAATAMAAWQGEKGKVSSPVQIARAPRAMPTCWTS